MATLQALAGGSPRAQSLTRWQAATDHHHRATAHSVSGGESDAATAPPLQRQLIVNGAVVSLTSAVNAVQVEKGGALSANEYELLRRWVTSWGPTTIPSTRISPEMRLSSGTDKQYPNYQEVLRALTGEIGARANLRLETDFAKLIPSSEKLQKALARVSRRVYRHVEKELATGELRSKTGGGQKEFWNKAQGAYRGLWNYVGEPYNMNYYMTMLGAFSAGQSLTFTGENKVPQEAFKDTLRTDSGSMTDKFASLKQLSNVYSDWKGKNRFRTPALKESRSGHISLDRRKGFEEQESEKRHNTQSLNESDIWTRYARQNDIPVSAGASGSMDRMYRLAKDAGATDLELIALALSGHFVFNQVYTQFSPDPHTFFEIFDVLHPYLTEKIPKDFHLLLEYMQGRSQDAGWSRNQFDKAHPHWA